MAEKSTSINLLPHQQGDSFLTQLLNWSLNIGRLLIILTEMVALGTFLYRFSLDMQIVDLHDKIKGESFIVANFKSSEANFRDIQDRLATSKRYTAIGATTTTVFSDITKMGQGKITFKDLTVTTQNVKISAQAPSATALSQFVGTLRNHPEITAVTVDKVANSSANAQVSVNITATLKPQAFAKEDEQPTNSANQPGIDNNNL